MGLKPGIIIGPKSPLFRLDPILYIRPTDVGDPN